MNPFNFPFDATTVDPSQGTAQMPVGRNPVIITGNETKATNNATGGMLVLDLLITDGPNKGQTGTHRLNLWNNNPKASEIAQKQLSALCHVTGRFKLNSFNDLNGIPFVVEAGYQTGHEPGPNNPEAKGYTEVKKVLDMQGNEPGKKPANQAPQPAAQSFPQQPNPGHSFGQPQPQPAMPVQAAPAWAAPGQGNPPAAVPAWGAPNAPQQAPAAVPTGSQPGFPSAPWSQAQAPAAGAKPPWG
jgi:Protein of unknown function (DUF669)